MEIHSATFVKSSTQLADMPKPDRPEYAFVGRSNVGKSSLINRLVDRQSMARTSSTPGKTQLINHFLINDRWYLADLPGYGYAKVSKKQRSGFRQMIVDYATQRQNLMTIFVLVDSRHQPQDIDLEFIEFLGVERVPFSVVLTKTDKPKQGELVRNLRALTDKLSETWEELPPIFQTSAVKGSGRNKLLAYIENINPHFTPAEE